MKTTKLLLVICAFSFNLGHAVEPYYTCLTNLNSTNLLAGLTTNTYTGTNYLDFNRYRFADISVTSQGSGTLSNYYFLSFVPGADSTNWDYTTPIVIAVPQQGTNRAYGRLAVDWTTYGYIKPYQWWSTNAMDNTNLTVDVWVKTVPRN